MYNLIANLKAKLGFNPFLWISYTRRMRRLVVDFEVKCLPEQDAKSFAIVVMPWMGTTVPWFSLICGLFLTTNRKNVTFIIDDLPFGGHRFRFRFLLGCIRSVLRPLC